MTYQFKIQIRGIIKPPVWRKIEVPADYSFLQFHEVIQTAFGWFDYHLFEFIDRQCKTNVRIAIPSEDDSYFDAETQNAAKVKLSAIFASKHKKLLYVYDFGDDWVHEITLLTVSNTKRKYAFCISGKGASPLEDCGGIYGYHDMKLALSTKPDSDEAETYREMIGIDKDEEWDINKVDISEINECLESI